MMSSAATLVAQSVPQSRLRLDQFLLVISYLLTIWDVPYKLHNSNQIRDILRRREVEWRPRIGTELYEDLKQRTWEERDRENFEAWGIVCMTVRAIHNVRLTQKDARDLVRWLLWKLQQISSDPFDGFVLGNRPQEGPQLGWRLNITLLGISVGVVPCDPDFPDDLTSLTPGELEDMESNLNMSELFRDDPLDRKRLETALGSIRDSLQDPGRLQFILSGSEPVPHDEAGSQTYFHPIGHRGSHPAYEVPKASNNVECGSDHKWLAAQVDHDELRPSWATDTQLKLIPDPLHEYKMQLGALQYPEVLWRLHVLETDVQCIKSQLGM